MYRNGLCNEFFLYKKKTRLRIYVPFHQEVDRSRRDRKFRRLFLQHVSKVTDGGYYLELMVLFAYTDH